LPGRTKGRNGPAMHRTTRPWSPASAIARTFSIFRSVAMLDIELCFEDGSVERRLLALPIEVGRAPDCHLRLKGWRVARRHARFERRAAAVFLEDFGSLAGTLVNGQRVAKYGPLTIGDEIVIGPCLLRVLDLHVEGGPGAAALPSTAVAVRDQGAADACQTSIGQRAGVAAD